MFIFPGADLSTNDLGGVRHYVLCHSLQLTSKLLKRPFLKFFFRLQGKDGKKGKSLPSGLARGANHSEKISYNFCENPIVIPENPRKSFFWKISYAICKSELPLGLAKVGRSVGQKGENCC